MATDKQLKADNERGSGFDSIFADWELFSMCLFTIFFSPYGIIGIPIFYDSYYSLFYDNIFSTPFSLILEAMFLIAGMIPFGILYDKKRHGYVVLLAILATVNLALGILMYFPIVNHLQALFG